MPAALHQPGEAESAEASETDAPILEVVLQELDHFTPLPTKPDQSNSMNPFRFHKAAPDMVNKRLMAA